MEGEFQDQGKLDQDLEEWFSPQGGQSAHGFFSEDEKKESIQIEYMAPEGEIRNNQVTEGFTYNMLVNK